MRGRADLSGLAATAIGLTPGFIFPFVAAVQLATPVADEMFLVTSIGVVLVSVVGLVVETNTIAEARRNYGDHRILGVRRYVSRAAAFATAIVIPVALLLASAYGHAGGYGREFMIAALIMAAMAIVGSTSGVMSGVLVAHGQSLRAISSQAVRTLAPLTVVIARPDLGVVGIACAFLLGEALRCILLTFWALEHLSWSGRGAMAVRGMTWQFAATASAQATPITDRMFLGIAPTGAVTAYELAEKVYFAGIQVVQSAFVLRRLPSWSAVIGMPAAHARSYIWRQTRVLACLAGGVAVAIAAALIAANALGNLPRGYDKAILWALIMLTTLPAAVLNLIGGRLLIIARRQRTLLPLAIATVSFNLVADLAFFLLFGAVGIAISSAVTRLFTAAIYAVAIQRVTRDAIS